MATALANEGRFRTANGIHQHPLTIQTAQVPHSLSDAGIIEQLGGHRAFVAFSPAMREVRHQVEQVASIEVPVLLQGETGTGKEVIARLIHQISNRAAQRFLKVNCAAVPTDLLESEMFGYEAGAFTGAQQAKAGKFEACHKGTILLDEIGEMPLSPQAKMLEVLQDGEFSRLGGTATKRVDVRVVAASNVNLQHAVSAGSFRHDLYYRLNVVTIYLPPLRERKEDIPHLLNHFMSIWSSNYGRPRLPVTRRIIEASVRYPWPGNVRELESFIKRYLVTGDEDQTLNRLEHEQWKGCPRSAETEVTDDMQSCDLKSLIRQMKEGTERTAIVRALKLSKGSKQEAASLLGISLRAVHYKIRRYEIAPRCD